MSPFSKSSFFEMLTFQTITQSRCFQMSPVLKRVFEKLCFRGAFGWDRSYRRNKAAFSDFYGVVSPGHKLNTAPS